MTRVPLAGGWSAALMGAAAMLPVLVAVLERGGPTMLDMGVVTVACGMIVGGVTMALLGLRKRPASAMPGGVRMAVTANVLFLAFFALELSDRLVRQDGQLFYWTTFLFPPALLLFGGLLAARRWAWWTFRGVAAFGVLWFLGFMALIPFVHLQANGVPIPWYGRVYMACVSLALGGILACAFWSLGRTDTRNYFGLARTAGQ